MVPLAPARRSARHSKDKLHLFCRHPVARERFARLLQRSGFDLVFYEEFHLPEITDSANPAVAVIDGSDKNSALELARNLRWTASGPPVLVLLPELEDDTTYALLRLGVKGLLSYQLVSRELCRAACQVAKGGYWVPRELLCRFVESVLPELSGCKCLDSEVGISRREREVLDLLLDNLSNKEIASKLFVTERTVKFHVSNLLGKFHVQRRADLIVMWMQRPSPVPGLARDLGRPLSAHVN